MFDATTGLVMLFEIELERMNSPVFVLLIRFKRSIFTMQLCVFQKMSSFSHKIVTKMSQLVEQRMLNDTHEVICVHVRKTRMKCTWVILDHENHYEMMKENTTTSQIIPTQPYMIRLS